MIVNRAELLKLTSRKLKANLRQLLAVLENNLVQEESALHFDLYGFRLECMALLNTTIVQIMSVLTANHPAYLYLDEEKECIHFPA
jgi:hypothetical protein